MTYQLQVSSASIGRSLDSRDGHFGNKYIDVNDRSVTNYWLEYFVAVMTSLAMLAWIGNLINNLLLTYLIIVFVVLLPGLRHRGIMQRYTKQLKESIKGLIQSKKKKN